MESDLISSSQPPQSTLSNPPTSKRKQTILIIVLIISILVFALASFWLFFTNSGKRINPLSTDKTSKNSTLSSKPNSQESVSLKQWVNCDDVREVIEEGDRLYVACLGGVVIADKKSGKVIDQVTMRDGLRSATATSLEKDGDILYIGTQDGFAVFNLKTRAIKTVSEPEGLISGSNIKLALDGDMLWVGTFKGLGKYNTKTGIIENFTTELADNSIEVSSSLPLVTKEALYFIVVANAKTSGSVARLDRATQTWERFGPSAFGKTEQHARIDMFDMEEINGKIFITDWKNIWEADNKKEATWKSRSDLMDQLIAQGFSHSNINFVNLDGSLGVITDNKVYKLEGDTLGQIYPMHGEVENVFAGIHDGISSVQDGKIWVMVGRYQDPWMRWVSTKDWKSGVVSMADRPKMIDMIKALIDDTVIITGDGAVWSYEINKNIFKKLVAFKNITTTVDGGTFIFRPVAGTKNVFVFQQGCGMGCGEPQVFLYNYDEQSIKPIEFSTQLQTVLKGTGEYGWTTLSYQSLTDTTKQVVFHAGAENKATLDLNTLAWNVEPMSPPPVSQVHESCNRYYTFKNSKFSQGLCTGTLETSTDRWEVERVGNNDQVYQVNKKTNEKIKLTVPMDPISYSPFENWTFPYAVTQSALIDGKLWLGSTRGLAMYDPIKKTWQLYAQKDGLISQEGVSGFVVGDKAVWVTTTWGGFSQIPLKD